MRTRIVPYKKGSQSAKALAEALGGLRLRTEGSKFRPRADDLLINWGSGQQHPRLVGAKVLNPPEKVRIVSNKLTFFKTLGERDPEVIPPFWTDRGDIPSDVYPVVCRTVLNGHSGDGIVIANSEEELVPAPLYTQYIKKKDEYRVHVGSTNRIISVQRKARKREVPDDDVNWMVRNHKNGFVFVRGGVNPPETVIDVAKRAIAVTGLDFGAVDVVYHERSNRAYVLEVNSAPGIEGSTVQDYVKYFMKEDDEEADEPAVTGDSAGGGDCSTSVGSGAEEAVGGVGSATAAGVC